MKTAGAMLNVSVVNGRGLEFFLTANIAIICVFTRKNAIQKVR
jgi:hypothetical protein